MTNISEVQFSNPRLDGYDYSIDKELGKTDFLTLLVTQLRYQDPLEPMQDQEFVAQLAQFSQLEQLENMSESLDTSIQVDYIMSQTIANTMATTLIGKKVVAEGANFDLIPGEDISLGYNLAADAASVNIKIFDDTGTLVKTVNLSDVSDGNSTYRWDGRNDNGSPLAAGNYTYEVSAVTLTGESITVENRVIGFVQAVKYLDGKAYLIVDGGYKVDLSTIIEIEQSDGSSPSNHS
jgi:flagellar basal-body rod modification protein FlgD